MDHLQGISEDSFLPPREAGGQGDFLVGIWGDEAWAAEAKVLAQGHVTSNGGLHHLQFLSAVPRVLSVSCGGFIFLSVPSFCNSF